MCILVGWWGCGSEMGATSCGGVFMTAGSLTMSRKCWHHSSRHGGSLHLALGLLLPPASVGSTAGLAWTR